MTDDTPAGRLSRLAERVRPEARRLWAQARKSILMARLGSRWDGGSLSRREYPDYETYLAHQRLKLDAFRERSIERHDRKFFSALRERLREVPLPLAGARVLCLAARQGTEVRAMVDAGAFAVGIDLNPGPRNRYVITGDFHHLQFADGTVDVVYTNSLDHAFDLGRLLGEVSRVLTPHGALLAEVGAGGKGGPYESLAWPTVDALVEEITGHGFRLERRTPFDAPWRGEALLLRRAPHPDPES